MLLFLLVAPAPRARAQSCDEFDADRNGVVTVADFAPIALEFQLVQSCLGTDLRDALACRESDLDRDGRVESADLRLLDDAWAPFAACLDADLAARVECASFDYDGNGRVEIPDFAPVLALHARVARCVGTDLAALACAAADHDGNGQIATHDVVPVHLRFAGFDACRRGVADAGSSGLWIDPDRLSSLPTAGAAWERLWSEATRPTAPPDLADPEDRADTQVLAQALAGRRVGDAALLASVRETLERFVSEPSERGAHALAVARNLVGYVLAADVIDLPRVAPVLDAAFRARLAELRDTDLRGRTLRSTHDERPNNWGTHAGASRVAIALYLGDEEDLAAAVEVHRAWLGDPRAAHTGFRFGDRSWQADAARPVGVNPRGARVSGIDVDGALPEEMRRGGPLADPPARTGYAWEALQGATVTTALLARNGHPDAWRWGDDALVRAVAYLYRLDARYGDWAASGDDRWNVWLVNRGTGSDFPTRSGVSVGKNMGFTDWTHPD